jgi:GNAT superfamily N-acetyltransferase
MRIRKAHRGDSGPISEILRTLEWFPHLRSERPEQTRERVERHLHQCHADKSHSVYVAEESPGSVVGYVAVHWQPTLFLAGPEGYVSELFVRASARGRGAGTQLLQAVQTEAAERGCVRLLVLNRRKRVSYQRNFYEKCGWKERLDAANFVFLLS